MKNRITSIIFLLLVILLVVAIWSGIRIGNFQILSVSELKQKDEEVNKRIQTASELTSVDYPESISTLQATYERHILQKQKYEELVGFTDADKKEIYETKQYDIGYLWKTVGKYATSRNLTISMEVKKGSGENIYDLYFTVSGQYVNISQFITDIENNSDLFFRIYNFKMSGSSEIVSSSFTVKDINIDPSTLTSDATVRPNSVQTTSEENNNIQ